jgi:hypothetical protein
MALIGMSVGHAESGTLETIGGVPAVVMAGLVPAIHALNASNDLG